MKIKRPLPVWALALIDILLTGVLLVVFAYFHHVRPSASQSEGIIVERPTDVVIASHTPEPTQEPVFAEHSDVIPDETLAVSEAPVVTATPFVDNEPDVQGSFIHKFADKFTSGEVIETEENGVYIYKSANLNITITPDTYEFPYYDSTKKADYYFVDFYVSDVTCISTCFAKDKFGSGYREWVTDMAKRTGAIVAVNGDYCGMRENGVVIRNGEVYRTRHSTFDACALYWDGSMETFASEDWTSDMLIKKGAYQAWSFGPQLLDKNGQPCKSFNATDAVIKRNPRTAIGYFEPGHYCFVVVDGRSDDSFGVTMQVLAELMQSLGCKCAYNLDGGQSSMLTWRDRVINVPYDGGRKMSDGIMLLDIGRGV